MKISLLLGLGLLPLASLLAQGPTPTPNFTPADLTQLAAPIALYPDPLIAIILPAAGDLPDLAAAGQYLAQAGSAGDVVGEPWGPSVSALVHYPGLLSWMNANLPYTTALGQAYAIDPTGLMQAIQRLRAQALAAGTLVNTPQQVVFTADGAIEIEPAQPDVIYVPDYNPAIVYDTPAVYGVTYISFGLGCSVGPWLGFGCDWNRGRIFPGFWRGRAEHERKGYAARVRDPNGRPWHQTGPVVAPNPYRAPRANEPLAAHEFTPRSPGPAAPRMEYARGAYYPTQPARAQPEHSTQARSEHSEAAHSEARSAPATASSSHGSNDNNNRK